MKRPLELMAFHDGELSVSERQRAAEELDSEELRYLRTLERQRAELRIWAERDDVKLQDQILSRIEAESQRPRHATRIAGALVGALALAASMVVWLGAPRAPSAVSERPVATHPQRLEEASTQAPTLGVSIESIDFGANNGSIFVIQGKEETTPVVWLSEAIDDDATMVPL